ncbi:alpha-glycosidase [Bacillus sp. JJ664]
MQKETIFHQPYDQYAFAINDQTYCLRLRTKKGDCTEAILYYGDPFHFKESRWNIEEPLPMYKAFSTEMYDFWEVSVTPLNKRMKYQFFIKNDHFSLFYGEAGFSDQFNDHDLSNSFTLPYLHKNELISPPNWVKKTVWYQIFPDRFASGNQLNNPTNTLAWGKSQPTNTSFYGGDIEGIIQKIDYLKDIGISGIYLTPIFEANSNHKYDTIDYFKIDPSFGDETTLKRLIQKCHDYNIRVMLDAVFNHTSYSFPPFQDVLVNGKHSKYYDWFHFHPNELNNGDFSYETFSFVKEMPKLNTENKDVQNFLLEIGSYWIKEFNIDGWRLDVANEIDHYFWKLFHRKMKEIKPDIFIVGEIWHHAMPWLRGDEFDSVMNYPLLKSLLSYFSYETISTVQFKHSINEMISLYPIQVIKVLFNIIGTHDTPRVLTQSHHQDKKVILLYVFLLTFFGTPCIYYGDEIGLTGGNDPECRSCMVWDSSEHNELIYNSLKKLISLRGLYPVLENEGEFKWIDQIDEQSQTLIYERSSDKISIFVFINPSHEIASVTLPIKMRNKRITNLWNHSQFAAESDSILIDIPPVDFFILKIESTDSII